MKHPSDDTTHSTASAPSKSRLHRMLDIPAGVLSGECRLELSGNHQALVDGCRGILTYNEHTIHLAADKMSICFTGEDLQIRVMTQSGFVVEGVISDIALIPKKKP